jgi:PAS domain S-box-containing protein
VADLNGYSVKEILGWKIEDFAKVIHPDDVAFAVEQARKKQAGKSDVVIHYPYRLITKSGDIKWADQYSKTVTYEGSDADLVTIIDITERKRAEEALQGSEERYRTMFEDAAIGVALVDMEGRPIESNPALHKMLGFSHDELREMPFPTFTHPEDVDKDWQLYQELISGKRENYHMEKRYIRKDEQVLWGHLTVSLVRNMAGEPLFAIGMVENITERKQAEAEREHLFKEISESQVRLKALSAELVNVQEEERRHLARELHDEIGQGLTAISLKLEGIDELVENSYSGRDLAQALAMIDQMLQQVRNLSLDLRPSMLDDLGLMPTLRWYLNRQKELGKFKVEFNDPALSERPPAIIETVCYRIVQEALTNIARHSGAANVKIEISEQGHELHLVIKDDGQGFDVERSLKEAALGKSTGLLGMQERAVQIGGRVEIQSKESHGTTIYGYFPYDS